MLSPHGAILAGLLQHHYLEALGITWATSILVYLLLFMKRDHLPLINAKRPFEFRTSHARLRFVADAAGLIQAGFTRAPIFRVLTENGYKTVLSPKYADEIRSLETLSFGKSIARDFHTHIHGFEPFKQGTNDDEIVQDAVRMKLTQSLGKLTKPLSFETDDALRKSWTDNDEWHEIPVKSSILQIVAQLSSRVFLGEEICRNPNWLRITVDYTVHLFIAAENLRMWPWIMRPLVARFLPSCRLIREELREANAIITPIVEKRRAEKEAARREGKSPESYSDAIEWMEQCAKGRPYHPEYAQLTFSVAAIHTTTDLTSQVLFNICGNDELIEALRREIITAFNQEGWKKAMLYKLKLMDSTIKETLRLKPTSITSMRRVASTDVHLSDGTTISKGSYIMVSSHLMWDSTVYPNPEVFDPYRFLNLRGVQGHETSSHLVSPSPEHLGFGLGKHACPGRFFAANEIKIALCHILLKYDIKRCENTQTQPRKMGVSWGVNPSGTIMIRRRQEEVQL